MPIFSFATAPPQNYRSLSVQAVKKRKKQRAKKSNMGKALRVSVGKRLVFIAAGFLLLAVIALAGVRYAGGSRIQTTKSLSDSVPAIKSERFRQPTTFAELVAIKTENLGSVDVGRMNLLCAEGLPGAENLRVEDYVATLDQWAESLRQQIDRNFHHYQENPTYFYNSTNFFKMVMMASILSSQFQIHYNPKLIESPTETKLTDDEFFADSRDALIHGLLGPERMGTCSSMPVLYVALGRRLGYPLKLVKAKGHLFLRWDSPTERFNMDGTQRGMEKYDDERYRKWPFQVTDEDIKADGILQSLTPAQ
jgi:hypothetical protein